MSTLYTIGQIGRAADALENAGFMPEDVTKLIQDKVALRNFLKDLRGRAEIRNIKVLEEKIIDTIIRVNRSVGPAYPDLVKEVLHKDMELFGPSEYDIGLVQEWYHPEQKNDVVKGKVIYQYQKDNDMIKDHLGLADLLAIQAKGIAFFRKYFAGKAVFGWKSVVRNSSDNLHVPYLIADGGEVIVHWNWLEDGWHSCDPALRFASK